MQWLILCVHLTGLRETQIASKPYFRVYILFLSLVVKNFIYLFIYLLCWVFLAVLDLFSSCSEMGLLSTCSVWASHGNGFSCRGAQVLGTGFSSCGTRAISSAVCRIFWDQRSSPCLWHWQADSLPLSHQGNHSFSLLKLGYPMLFFPQTLKLLILLVQTQTELYHQLS